MSGLKQTRTPGRRMTSRSEVSPLFGGVSGLKHRAEPERALGLDIASPLSGGASGLKLRPGRGVRPMASGLTPLRRGEWIVTRISCADSSSPLLGGVSGLKHRIPPLLGRADSLTPLRRGGRIETDGQPWTRIGSLTLSGWVSGLELRGANAQRRVSPLSGGVRGLKRARHRIPRLALRKEGGRIETTSPACRPVAAPGRLTPLRRGERIETPQSPMARALQRRLTSLRRGERIGTQRPRDGPGPA
jgi:hypothetical protein